MSKPIFKVGTLLIKSGRRSFSCVTAEAMMIVDIDYPHKRYMILEEEKIEDWDWDVAEAGLMVAK